MGLGCFVVYDKEMFLICSFLKFKVFLLQIDYKA